MARGVAARAQGRRAAAPAAIGAAALAMLEPAERLAALRSETGGLTEAEAARRLALDGPNEPVRQAPRHRAAAVLAQFTHTLALLLWFAAGLAFAARLPELGGAIVAVVLVNGAFAAMQEYHAERVVQGLMRHVAVRARVLRAGHERVVPAGELARGDVVVLAAGDVVPADCVLLAGEGLTLDLSLLTGETLPVERSAGVATGDDASREPVELACIAPAGAAVVTGAAHAAVWSTGPASTLGRVAALVAGTQRGESVLERQVDALSRTTAVIAVLAGAATLGLATAFTDTSFAAALTFATGVIVALVPEGLLPTLSVALALGARRMAERGAAVRRLAAVEVIGAATVICTDKTGTLTENALSVLAVEPAPGVPPGDALLVAQLCNDARATDGGFAGDAIDVALAEWARAQGGDPSAQRWHPRLSEVTFDAHRRYMTVTCDVDGAARELVKGAPEAVLALLGVSAPATIDAALAAAAARGERVLLLGSRDADGARLAGLARLHDPPRPEVPAALAACRRAGVRVIMLTGDHPTTARAVAAQVGLGNESTPLLDGATLATLSDAALLRALGGDAICARITPEQKLRVVTLLRRAGEVVVVTGDGVNDAPALRAADVGVAMGRRGTEVAKQAADIVLADDHFATLVAAIEEGRSLKQNIRRFVSYVFTSNVAELTPFLLFILLPVPLALAVIQALAIDVGTDLVPALALGAEPPSAGAMGAPPEPAARRLLTRSLALRTFLWFGLVEAALGLAGFALYHVAAGWRPFADFAPYAAIRHEAMTATFLAIVGGQLACLVAQRGGPLRARLGWRRNPLVAVGVAFELALALALVYTPGLNGAFEMAAVGGGWLLLVPGSAAVFLAADQGRRLLAAVR
jgi:calcium-translocating P-type ATPase